MRVRREPVKQQSGRALVQRTNLYKFVLGPAMRGPFRPMFNLQKGGDPLANSHPDGNLTRASDRRFGC
jgi:hypothetical protein